MLQGSFVTSMILTVDRLVNICEMFCEIVLPSSGAVRKKQDDGVSINLGHAPIFVRIIVCNYVYYKKR